jgi:hypothetical protein
MSWNISTRLNNLQQQVNNIANTGLTNPLEQQLNANSYNMINLNTLNANSNVLKLQSNNVGGIETNCNVTVDGNLTCETLNYTSLNPPVQGGGENLQETLTNGNSGGGLDINEINNLEVNTLYYLNLINGFLATYTLGPGMTQSGNNITAQTGGVASSFISNSTYLNPSVSSTIGFNNGGGYVQIGLVVNNALWGAFWYGPESSLYVVNNGVNGSSVSLPLGTYDISVVVLNGNMNIYVNDAVVPSLEISIPSGNYNIYGITNLNTVFSNIITSYAQAPETGPTLSEVLANGNSAGNASITGVNELTVDTLNYTTLNPPINNSQNIEEVLTVGNNANGKNLTGINELTVDTLNYTTLNPPITGGGENLQQTLTNGNNAGGLDIVGVNNLQINYGNCQNIQFFSGNTGVLKQGVNNGNLVISNNNFASSGTVFDSLYNSPIPFAVKIINSVSFIRSNFAQASNGVIFTLLLDEYYTNKINYAKMDIWDIVINISDSRTVYMFLTDDTSEPFDVHSNNYSNLTLIFDGSNNNNFRNTTGLTLAYTSPTPFNVIYLCVYTDLAISSFNTNISCIMNFGVNVPTITANPT